MSRLHHWTFIVRVGLVALLLLIWSAASSPSHRAVAQSDQPTPTPAVYVDPQLAPYEQLLASSEAPPTVYFKKGGFPRSILGSFPTQGADVVEMARNFVEQYKTLYLIDSPDLTLITRTTDAEEEDGVVIENTVIFDQAYKGVKVYGAQLIVTVGGNAVVSAIGSMLTQHTPDLNVVPSITRADAETLARAAINSPDVPIVAETIRLIYDKNLFDDAFPSDPRVTWRIVTARPNPWIVFVDAHTGDIVDRHSLVVEFDLDLENAHGMNAASTSCYWWTSEDEEIGDEDGVYEEFDGIVDAVAAWNAAWGAYNFFNDNFGLESFDDDDAQLEVYINATPPNTVAQWVPGSTDCDLIDIQTGWVSLDIVVHEYTHGVITYRPAGNITYSYQSGALNEALADIMSSFADGTWVIGDGTTGGGGPIRDAVNPTNFNQPNRMSNYVNTSNDNGGVHINSGIINKAASLIADGGAFNGFTINGIGRSKAMRIFYAVLRKVPQDATLLDARNAAVSRALWYVNPQMPCNAPPGFDCPSLPGAPQGPMYGFTMQDVCQIRNAFAAVELGNSDKNCDGIEENLDPDGDSIYGDDNCPTVWNPNQLDYDKDGKGDACDQNVSVDVDGDGVPEQCYGVGCGLPDNCPGVYNPDQTDANFNGIGKACDPTEDEDFDDDGILNVNDNCYLDYNPDQADVDNDGDGDACDPDGDGDGISNDDDNCIDVQNHDQANSDNDPIGDACDQCPEGDDMGVAIGYFQDPITGEIHTVTLYDDADGDGIPDGCDDSFTVDGFPSGGLFPDCVPHSFSVRGNPRSYLGVALSHYMEEPEVWYPLDAQIVLTLEGMPDTVRTWILDDEARTLDESHEPGTRVLDFRPMGGQQYYLVFDFSPYVGENERIYFQGNMTLELGQQTKCPPRVPRPTPPAVDIGNDLDVQPTEQAQPAADCGGFRLASPREGMLNGMQQVYWDPAPGAEVYRVNLYNEAGALVFTQDVPTPTTMTTLDTRSQTIGEGNFFDLEVLALTGGAVTCSDRVRQARELPTEIEVPLPLTPTVEPGPGDNTDSGSPTLNLPNVPILVPICGNNICEAGETNVCCTDCECIE